MTFHGVMQAIALLMMTAACVGVGLSIGIGHTVLTVLFAVLALVFYNLSRWHVGREQHLTEKSPGQH